MDRDLVEDVLGKLGFSDQPEPALSGLSAIYQAWCEKVPFDNVRKLIHLAGGRAEPLPGDTADDFFRAWLRHGCGGTCWAGNGALHGLLDALGFEARRAVATMVAAPNLPPNHGSVVVSIDGVDYVVDASILHREPLPMRPETQSAIDHPAWGVTARWAGATFTIRWRNFVARGGEMDCEFNTIGASAEEFSQRHEMTRGWSPFNFGLSLNIIRGNERVGAGWGNLSKIDQHGAIEDREADLEARRRFLIEIVGMSEEIAAQLPDDREMTPPPK
jgi:N-hydroxyarylamine O-acetyltransferase